MTRRALNRHTLLGLVLWASIGALIGLSISPTAALLTAPVTIALFVIGFTRFGHWYAPAAALVGTSLFYLFAAVRADYRACPTHIPPGEVHVVCGGTRPQPLIAASVATAVGAVAAGLVGLHHSRHRHGHGTAGPAPARTESANNSQR